MRTVIQKVVANFDDHASEIVLLIHWIGGTHTELRLPKRRRGQRSSTSTDIIAAIRQLVLIASDDLIASILNRNGLVTGHGNRWTRERVTAHRSHHKIPDAVLDLGLGSGDRLMRLRQFLYVVYSGAQRIVIALRRLDPEHVQDHLRILGIVLVPTVVQGLPGSGERQ